MALFQAGQLDKADRKCRQIISANPTQVDAMHLRATIAMRRGDSDLALKIMTRAASIRPSDAKLQCNLGNMHMAANAPALALQHFNKALAADGHLSQAHFGAGMASLELSDFAAAERHLRKALKKSPRNAEILLGLSRTMNGQARAREAAQLAENAIAVEPANPAAHAALALAREQLGDFDGAIAAHRTALEKSGNAPRYRIGLVISLAAFGHIKEAQEECRGLLADHPDFAPAHFRLATLVRQSSTAEIDEMERLVAKPDLPARERLQLEFALGAGHEGHQNYERAFAHYQTGNRLVRDTIDYATTRAEGQFRAMREAFPAPSSFDAHIGGCEDTTPIFVVGMPRSGTTLVEHILSSHPDIAGANELETIPRLFTDLMDMTSASTPAAAMSNASASELRKLGETYVAELKSYSDTALHVVDKLPGNFIFLGFIKAILPRATIIHCRRDPMDTCLSIFKTRFVRGAIDYGYDMVELGDYHRRYQDLMRHWAEVLPSPVIDVIYEELVGDPGEKSRALISALGLEWSDACDRFYETSRTVQTASVAQVRRPIYTSSIGKADQFGAALDPLRAALAGPQSKKV